MQWLRLGTGLLLAAFMVFMGLQKFGADNAVFDFIATQSGIALFEPVVRMATGVAELLAAVLILVGLFANRLRGVGHTGCTHGHRCGRIAGGRVDPGWPVRQSFARRRPHRLYAWPPVWPNCWRPC